ncbi:MAG: hypothetical protein GY711_00090 [bacterium]|nr:hypothetical protein [bacterium]
MVGQQRGAVSVYLAGSSTPAGTFQGIGAGEGLGSALDVLGDLNNDGFPELAVGGTGNWPSMTSGIVRVFSGAGFAQDPVQWNALFTLSGTSTEAHGSANTGSPRPPTLRMIRNNFSGGATLDVSDIPTGATTYVVIGSSITKQFAFLGIEHLVVPTLSVQVFPDVNGRFTFSFVPPAGAGQLFHQIVTAFPTELGGSNIIGRVY